jgi:MoaA/NifB/PqqE/SkfB family radical SAM enzyme
MTPMKALRRIPGFLRTLRQANRREPGMPRFLTYTVTFTCNARCIMCDSWKMESPDDLRIDEIERIFSELPPMDAVRLTGGEPFIRKDLPQIAELVRTRLRPFFLHITTNGFLSQRIIDFCETRDRSMPLQLLISVDGLRDKHNHVRGRDTAWDSVMKTLHALAPRREELRLSLAVNQTVVDAEGARQYSLLREELRPLGIKNHFVLAYDTSATYNLEREKEIAPSEIGQFTTFGEFGQDQLEALMNEVEDDLKEYPLKERLAKRYYLRGIRNRLLNGHGHPNPKCVALSTHMRLFPNGDVPTCQFNSKTVGNLRHQSFRDVWFGERIRPQRQWVNKCPGCWAECEVLPSAIYTGDLLRETVLPRPTALQ